MILDIGCGENKRGDIGIDVRKLEGVDVIADMHCLPFKGNTFDQVRSVVVLEHSPNPFQCIKEQARVLKTGGKLYCETDNARYWRYHVFLADHARHFKSERYSASETHYMIFYPENIERMLKLATLRSIKWKYCLPGGKSRKLDRIIRLFLPENSYPRFYVIGIK